jgi:hypothetical protein
MKINTNRFYVQYKKENNRAVRADKLTGWQIDKLLADDKVSAKIELIAPMGAFYTPDQMRAARLLA